MTSNNSSLPEFRRVHPSAMESGIAGRRLKVADALSDLSRSTNLARQEQRISAQLIAAAEQAATPAPAAVPLASPVAAEVQPPAVKLPAAAEVAVAAEVSPVLAAEPLTEAAAREAFLNASLQAVADSFPDHDPQSYGKAA